MRRRSLAAMGGLALVLAPGGALGQQPGPYPPGQLPPPGPPPGVAPPQGWSPSVQAGGLAPPPILPVCLPPLVCPQQPQPPERKAPPKRRLNYFWANLEGGYSHLGFQTFDGIDDPVLAAAVPRSANGGDIGMGLGARFLFLTGGARARLAFYDRFQTVTAGAEIGIHLPFGRVEPHFDFGGGYLKMLSLDAPILAGGSQLSLDGGYVRFTGGLDLFPSPFVSVGFTLDGDVVVASAKAGSLSGGSVGGAVTLAAVLGLHI